jgi:(2S)-methylsuccinyl-CoA dehydrogenase
MTDIPNLSAAADVVALGKRVVETAARHVRANGGVDQRRSANQVVAYDLAHAAAAIENAGAVLDYGAKGDVEARIACGFVADAVHDLMGRTVGREALWGIAKDALTGAADFVRTYRDPSYLASLARTAGPRHLDPEFEMVQDTFRRFAEEKVDRKSVV